MKKSFAKVLIIFFAAVLVAALVIFISGKVSVNKYKNAALDLPQGFTVTGHTGCQGTKENSIESIEAGYKYADITEFDLNFTSDGSPILSHDKPSGDVLTLDDAFKVLASCKGLLANVDVKTTEYDLSVVEKTAAKYNVSDRIFFTGVDEDDVEKVKTDCPNTKYYLNVSDIKRLKLDDTDYLKSLADKVKNIGAVGINLNQKYVSKALVDVFHESSLLVSVWTVDEDKDMYKMLFCAPDNITTRNPERLGEIIADKKGN